MVAKENIYRNMPEFLTQNFDPYSVQVLKEESTTEPKMETILIDGYECVDLGLPSGTLWATTNVGAEYENGTGQYYQYGKGDKTWNQTHSEADYTGVENPLSSSKDTATQVWGGHFRTPTQDEFIELINNTTREYVTDYKGTGTDGLVFTGQNGNYIFFPAGGGKNTTGEDYPAGYGQYWSSTPYGTTWTDSAKSMAFYQDSWLHCEGYFSFRKEGCCIRPVMDVTQ